MADVNLDIPAIVCYSAAILIKTLILLAFLYQCSNYKQLNYDLTVTYSILTKIALARLVITIPEMAAILTYDLTYNLLSQQIAVFLSIFASISHLLFFVLRLNMTFLHTNHQLSNCTLFAYLFVIIIALTIWVIYFLLPENDKDETLLAILFAVGESLRLFILFLVSFQFIYKLILLGIEHYTPNSYEMKNVNLVKYEKTQQQNNIINNNNTNIVSIIV